MKKTLCIILFVATSLLMAVSSYPLGLNQFNGQQIRQENDRVYRLMQETIQSWDDGSSSWLSESRIIHHYSAEYPTRIDSMSIIVWDEDSLSYIPFRKILFLYDNPNGLATQTQYYVIEGNISSLLQQCLFSYNAQNYLTTYITYTDAESTGEMVLWSKMQIDYLSDQEYHMHSWKRVGTGGMQQWTNTTYVWDTQGRITHGLSQVSSDSTNWVNKTQFDFVYQAGDTTTGTEYLLNLARVYPFVTLYYNFTHSYGKVTEYTVQYWEANAWVHQTRQTFQYNPANYLTDDMHLYWDGFEWVNSNLYEYNYDNNNNVTDFTFSLWNHPDWNPDNRTLYTWESVTPINDDSITPEVLPVRAYPNPFTQTIKFELSSYSQAQAEVSIYNLKGEKIKASSFGSKSDLTIDAADWANGVYLVKLVQGGRQSVQKIVKIK